MGMFCSPTRTPRARQNAHNGGACATTTPGLTLDEKVLMNEADVERDENLLSCCQTYLSQLKSVLRLQHQQRQNKSRHGQQQLPAHNVARIVDELNIACVRLTRSTACCDFFCNAPPRFSISSRFGFGCGSGFCCPGMKFACVRASTLKYSGGSRNAGRSDGSRSFEHVVNFMRDFLNTTTKPPVINLPAQ